MRPTLLAFFDDDSSARRAAKELVDVGLDRRDVRVLVAVDAEGLAALGLSSPDAERCAARLRAGEEAVAATIDAERTGVAREILERDGVVEAQGTGA